MAERKTEFLIDVDKRVRELVSYLDYKYGFDGEQLPVEVEYKIREVIMNNLTEYTSEVKGK